MELGIAVHGGVTVCITEDAIVTSHHAVVPQKEKPAKQRRRFSYRKYAEIKTA